MENKNSLLRAAYERVAALFPDFICQRSELRMERALQNNVSAYTFQVKQGNNTTDGPNQILLNDEDAFVLVATQVYVMKQQLAPAAGPAQYNNTQRFTYPDPQVFTGAPASRAEEWQALFTIWNGQLSFNTGSLQRIKPIDLYSHLYVPQAQVINPEAAIEDVAIGNGRTNPSLAEFGGFAMENYAWVEHQPTPIFDGKQNNSFTIGLGSGDLLAIQGNYTAAGVLDNTLPSNVLGLRALGILIANGAAEMKRFKESWDLQR